MEYDPKIGAAFQELGVLQNRVLMSPDQCFTGDETSFAFTSARDRWPIILVCALRP
jgi:hypothetical protein